MNAYVALYRKYRPKTFAELVGQEAVARTLANAITQHRLAHAYLFCGPRGTGKTSVARILAKSVNCKTGPTDFPCGTCSNCLEITNGNHLDVIEIDAASNNGVDNIRDLQDRVALAPVAGRYKVYIIDEVHMLSQGAFNALLKTLEEPPPNVLFVLATTDPHKVLATIISRCQRFDFGRIPLQALVDRMAFVASQEGFTVEAAGLEAIARRANGGLRDALSLLDQIAAMADGQTISAEQVGSSLGVMSGESVCALGRALLTADVPTALELATEILAAGYDHGAVLRELLAHFRHLMLLQLAPERASALEVPTSQLEELKDQARIATSAELPWILETLNATEGVMRRASQQAIWLELGLIKVATRPSIPSFTELVERVARLEATLASGGAIAPTPAAAAPVRSAPPAAARPTPPAPVRPAPVASPEPGAPDAVPQAQPAAAASAAKPVFAPPAPVAPPTLPPSASARPATPAADAVAVEAPVAMPVGSGERFVPPGAWERVREHVKSRSVPTAALLEQQAAIDRWEADGAIVIRIGKAFKDTFDRTPAKKKLLADAIEAIFGAGNFPRLEVGDPKAMRASTPAKTAPPPVPVATMSVAPPSPPPPASIALEEVPPPDVPPAWLDDYEDSRPEADDGSAVPASKAAPAAAEALAIEDAALKLTTELFNGRVMRAGEVD